MDLLIYSLFSTLIIPIVVIDSFPRNVVECPTSIWCLTDAIDSFKNFKSLQTPNHKEVEDNAEMYAMEASTGWFL